MLNTKIYTAISFLIFVFALSSNLAMAVWQAPISLPPGKDTLAPINLSGTDQIKMGVLRLWNDFFVGGVTKILSQAGIGQSFSINRQPDDALQVSGKIRGTSLCIREPSTGRTSGKCLSDIGVLSCAPGAKGDTGSAGPPGAQGVAGPAGTCLGTPPVVPPNDGITSLSTVDTKIILSPNPVIDSGSVALLGSSINCPPDPQGRPQAIVAIDSSGKASCAIVPPGVSSSVVTNLTSSPDNSVSISGSGSVRSIAVNRSVIQTRVLTDCIGNGGIASIDPSGTAVCAGISPKPTCVITTAGSVGKIVCGGASLTFQQ